MRAFEYVKPTSLNEALDLLADRWGEVEVLAGGTDLLSLMKDYIHTPRRVVDIKGIEELKGIQRSGDTIRIGALVTIEELLQNSLIQKEFPALIQAARGITSMQIRNRGTVGGDLCQRPRCWYFRKGFGLLARGRDGQSLVPNGENEYHAILGNDGPAYFVSASSFGPPLAALGAKVKLVSKSGSREVEVAQFFVTPKSDEEREIALRPNEILTEIIVPTARGKRNATYEIRERHALDWPLATASVVLEMSGNRVQNARIYLGHVAPVPWHAAAAEKVLAGKTLDEQTAEQAGEAAVQGARPLSQNGYKVQLAKVAVKRALLRAIGKEV